MYSLLKQKQLQLAHNCFRDETCCSVLSTSGNGSSHSTRWLGSWYSSAKHSGLQCSKRVVQSIPTLKKHLSRLRWARSAQFVWTSWVQPGLKWSKYSASKLNCLSHLRSSESSSTPRCSNDASHGNCCATSRCMFQLDWTTREIQRFRVRCMSCMSCMLGF